MQLCALGILEALFGRFKICLEMKKREIKEQVKILSDV